MRTYSRPVAEVDLFCLDSEFAGACLSQPELADKGFEGSLVDGLFANVKDDIAKHNEIGVPVVELGDVQELIRNNKGLTFEIIVGLTDEQLLTECENAVINLYMGHVDNDTSGHCYFTYSNARMKTFS